jgi:hypothetical protein
MSAAARGRCAGPRALETLRVERVLRDALQARVADCTRHTFKSAPPGPRADEGVARTGRAGVTGAAALAVDRDGGRGLHERQRERDDAG